MPVRLAVALMLALGLMDSRVHAQDAPPPPLELVLPDLQQPEADDAADLPLHNGSVGGDLFNEPVEADGDEFAGLQTDINEVNAAHAAYLQLRDLQLERPENPPEPPKPRKPPPRWIQGIADFLANLAPLFKFAFYLAVGAVVLGFLYFLFGEAIRMRLGRSGKGKVDNPDDVLIDIRPDAQQARSLLEEADALARAGKFAEAVHLLLFRSIDDIQQRLEGGVPRSLTAREIGGLGNLPERARRALGPIIQLVEYSFFGGKRVDESGWKSARASYEDFAFGEGWS